ncbi:MAG TPA: hypothetical protein DCM28_03655 [Phycisphaerales bacterium]|nr:hypothetical protein [Phycisphaerales bacterium]HCD34387.1 hypothetical protein [Phycisphaerales bacterium]|tara:strand:- start:1043 stop:2086 length:1044 start_codon:yes stop_codon:yes gene_type:complete
MAQVTLKQIALDADVSEMTVSKVLSGRYQPTQRRAIQRAEHIRKIAMKLGYQPNAAAKAIRSGRFGAISLLMSVKPYRGALFSKMLIGITDTLAERDMKLTMARLADDQLTDAAKLPMFLRETCCDGMLVNYTDDVPEQMVDLIDAHRLPAVWVNTQREHDCVSMDDLNASSHATQQLIELGHKQIAYVDYTHGPTKVNPHYSVAYRREGYEQAMREAGLPSRQIRCQEGRLVPANKRVALSRSWLSRPDRPTAVVCYGPSNEALPIMHAAMMLGLDVPRDLSLITFGENHVELLGPSIGMMIQPTEMMGRHAVEMLIQKIANPTQNMPHEKLALTFDPCQTVVRPR